MTKKIAYIHGSPRKSGNTSAISRIAIEAALEHGADVTEIDATSLEFKVPGCVSCRKCHQSDGFECLVGDELAETVATLIDYDVIVLATPTYWMSYPAQVKMFIDRMGSLMKFTDSGEIQTPLAGKFFAILATGNGVLENNLDLLETQWRNVASMMSCRFSSCLLPNVPVEQGAIVDDPVALKKANDFGKLIGLS